MRHFLACRWKMAGDDCPSKQGVARTQRNGDRSGWPLGPCRGETNPSPSIGVRAVTGADTAQRLGPRTYAAVPAQAMQDRNLKGADWRVLTAISWRADPSGYAWPSQGDIAAVTGLARPTVGKSISRLRQLGYLEIIKRRRRRGHWPANSYRVNRRRPVEPSEEVSPNNHVDDTDRVTDGITDPVTAEVT